MRNPLNTVFMLIGSALTLVVILNLASWIAICSVPSRTFQQSQIQYLANYPKFLQNAGLLTWLYIGVGGLAIYFFSKIGQSASALNKSISKILIVVNLIIILWQIFSLM